MQSNAPALTLFTAVFGLPMLACTAQVEPGGDGPRVHPRPAATAMAPSADSTDTVSSSSQVAVPAASWPGNVGTWCGPVEKQTLWLNARPQAAACDSASDQLYTTGAVDTAEGLTLELDAASLETLPSVLTVPANYCAPGGIGCTQVQVSLSIESFTTGLGLSGKWSFTAPDGNVLSGIVDAGWCDWDRFLPPHPEADRLARDVRIREVSVYQGVKVPIVRDQQAVTTRNADLVQEREALVRVFVDPLPGFTSRPLSARLTLQEEGEKPRYFEQVVTVSGPSSETEGGSTFNLELPKDAFGPTTQYEIELRETSRCTALSGTPSGARFPEQGLAAIGARRTGPVKVMLVPVRYEADGSGRMPELTPERLLEMSRRMYAMYPTTDVMLSVREVVDTDRTDLGDMLDQVRELRVSDAAPADMAYYGMVRQAETFKDYCQGACTMGLAGFGSMNGTSAAGMGVAFPETAAGTFVHELGHIYRRPHAPCGNPASPDASYPYTGAKLGSWGYDFQTHEIFDPETHFDFMSYCGPDWISDYNYQQILERIVVVNQRAFSRRLPADLPHDYRTLRVAKNGATRWGLDLHPQFEPPGDPLNVKVLDAQGALLTETRAYLESSPEGEDAYFIPAGHPEWHAIQVPGGAIVPFAAQTSYGPFRRKSAQPR
ncbi:MAG TPA: M66 family metalloprotease [Polyangiaceae bacterium]|nr:M66 family metalloprotease [Polyangiaceae bacterium]